MQKNRQKFIQNPPGKKEKQCLTFSYWHFFLATYCTLFFNFKKTSQENQVKIALPHPV
jgi:hypothetical protein